ncbi:MAG: transposase [Pirellulales bacterium]
MPTQHFIALDTHCEFCEMVAVSQAGRIVKRERCETTIPALIAALETVRGPRMVTFEEGPLADWLARNLRPHAERLIVCEPRRNALIAKESDKDDPIDAEKLAQLLRGGYLKEVHQTQSLDRTLLKQHVSFYHDRVRERVRQGHQLVAQLRRHGVFASINDMADPERRLGLWKRLPQRKVLLNDLQCLLQVYELLVEQEAQFHAELVRLARREKPVRRFQEVPGFGWIRSITFYVYVDTPARFASKSALWRYCGIGLERRHSGNGPCKVRLAKPGHRRLKDVLLGAAKSAAVPGDSPFADKFRHWTQEEGIHPSTARRNVARCLATTLWSMWKTGSQYDPAQVRGVGRPSPNARR